MTRPYQAKRPPLSARARRVPLDPATLVPAHWYTTPEAGAYLGISDVAVLKLIHRGSLPARKRHPDVDCGPWSHYRVPGWAVRDRLRAQGRLPGPHGRPLIPGTCIQRDEVDSHQGVWAGGLHTLALAVARRQAAAYSIDILAFGRRWLLLRPGIGWVEWSDPDVPQGSVETDAEYGP